jgi:hypothetical protein
MKLLISSALFACLLNTSIGFADDHGSDASSEVWDIIEASWVDDAGETGKWPGDYLHDEAYSWSAGYPAPRDADSIAKWSRFMDGSSETLMYELFPMQMTVVGDTAVVHYAVVSIETDSEGKRQRESTGIVETLSRVDDKWMFVGLTSFELGGD